MDTKTDRNTDAEFLRQRELVMRAARRRRRHASQALRTRLLRNAS